MQLDEIVSTPMAAFVSDYKWISLAFERGWITKYVGGIRNFDRLDLFQISIIFEVFCRYYSAALTPIYKGWFDVLINYTS